MTLKFLMQSSGSTALAAILAAITLPVDSFAAENSDRGGHGQWSQRGGQGSPDGGNRGGGGGFRGNPSINWGGGQVQLPRNEPRGDFRPRQTQNAPQPRVTPAPNWTPRTPDRPVMATPTWNNDRPTRVENRAGANERRGEPSRDWSRGRGNGQAGQVANGNDGRGERDRERNRDWSRGRGGSQGGPVAGNSDGPGGNDAGEAPRRSRDRNQSYSDPDRNRDYRNHDRDGYRDAWRRDGDRNGWRRDHDRDGWRHYERDGKRYKYRGWNNGWRHDRRYDWYDYRRSYGDVYRIGRYHSPYRHHRYSRLSSGFFLDSLFFSSQYWIDDPWRYRLPEAYGPYRWVRYYDDALLVDVYSGEVVDVINDFFW